MQGAAMFRNVTCGLRHVQVAWMGPFQGLTPAGSGRQVREGSTTLFTNQHRIAVPARRCGERASPKLTSRLAATKIVPWFCQTRSRDTGFESHCKSSFQNCSGSKTRDPARRRRALVLVPVPAALPPRSAEASESAGVLCMQINYKPQEQFSSFKL